MKTEQTIAFRVYKNGRDLLGIANVSMPELNFLTETISGSGIAGEYEAPTIGMTQSMTLKFSWTSQSPEFFSLLDSSTQPLYECRSSLQVLDETTGIRKNTPLILTVLGSAKKATLGDLETGKKHGNETELEILRLTLEMGDEERLAIDKMNFIYRVNGVDLLAGVRSDLGLA